MFSVIIPVYNKADTLGSAVDSVRAQSDSDWELIVVDDGSTDSPEKALAPYRQDSRIRMVRQENQGVSVARNRGISLAKGEYLLFLDADDKWLPNRLAVIRKMIEQEPGAGIYCTAIRIENTGKNGRDNTAAFTRPGIWRETDLFRYMAGINGQIVTAIAGSCVSAEMVAKYGGFQPGVIIGEDTDFFLKIAAYCDVVLTGEVTAVYQQWLSTATKQNGMLDYDWYFMKREQTLLSDHRIPLEKRRNIRWMMDFFRVHMSRHYILDGNRKRGLELLRQVEKHPNNRKRRYLTAGMLLVPTPVLRWIYRSKKRMEEHGWSILHL